MWQDSVIAVCQLGAVAALIPIILSDDKPSPLASSMNFIFAGVVSATLATLHFWFATTTAGLISVGWLIILIQKLSQTKKH